jgi:hypothetical protein
VETDIDGDGVADISERVELAQEVWPGDGHADGKPGKVWSEWVKAASDANSARSFGSAVEVDGRALLLGGYGWAPGFAEHKYLDRMEVRTEPPPPSPNIINNLI